MWFIYFYGISTSLTIIIMLIISKSIGNKMKREGLKFRRRTFAEGISAFLPYLIPFINTLLVLIAILNQQSLYEVVAEKAKNEMLKEKTK